MKEMKETAASWARSFMAAALGMWMAGISDPKTLALGGVAAIAPVVLRWLNPKDAAFGIKSK
jgi:hypothetical protein